MSNHEKSRTLMRQFRLAAQLIDDMKRQDADMGLLAGGYNLSEARVGRAYAWHAHRTPMVSGRRKREESRALAHSLACAWGL